MFEMFLQKPNMEVTAVEDSWFFQVVLPGSSQNKLSAITVTFHILSDAYKVRGFLWLYFSSWSEKKNGLYSIL